MWKQTPGEIENMTVVVKVHHRDGRTIVAVADQNLLGKKFEEDGKQLDLTGDFYKGEPMTDTNGISDLLRNADIVNVVGKEAVQLSLDEDVIEEDQVITIDNIPHAQVALIHD